ncbi:MAG TPA: glutamine--tRNA ligase/YqeY domain fusion protein [Polyangiaceae bacterium]|nr:glutamine--tRNA ligase/YqeY domain fusion protein [Polyangiaceae bacterium]
MSEARDNGPTKGPDNFITDIIDADLESGKHTRVVTRFPPEPNGYLHIGHAKSICLNFGIADKYGGVCHLRFDDTNPAKEDMEYVRSIQADVAWLGYDPGEAVFFASDYYQRLYDHAVELVNEGLAYVDSVSDDEMRRLRGTVTEPGTPSPYRDRSVEENLELLERMKAGEFEEGEHVLRAKIDLSSPNMKMRDPAIYRIKKAPHYRTGDAWCIYPLYDFTHCLSDSFEGITHSLCTLEFENNRELYDWFLDNLDVPCHPQQIEFARLSLSYTLMSKRKLLQLVEENHVRGWDDPRMPTLAGLRRRGVTPASIRAFCDMIGVAKANSTVDVGKLEYCIRDDLNHLAPRAMGVIDPLEVVVTNYPEGQTELFEAPSFPPDVGKPGSRQVPFSRRLFIDRDDFMEEPTKGFRRLSPGEEVRLRYAYVVRCDEVVKDDDGRVIRLVCSYDPDTRGATAPKDRKVKGTIHWVSAEHAVVAEVRLYDRLFSSERPEGLDDLNPESLRVVERAMLEPNMKGSPVGSHFQLERVGYFRVDEDSDGDRLVLNRTVTLRDTWAKLQRKAAEPKEARADEPSAPTPKPPRPSAPKREPLTDEQQGRHDRYVADGVDPKDARRLAQSDEAAALFETAKGHGPAPAVAKWIVNELFGPLKSGALPFDGSALGELVTMAEGGELQSRAAKRVLGIMVERGGRPEAIVSELGLEGPVEAGALDAAIAQVVASHPDEVARYRDGKKSLLGFFLGQVMKVTKGQADPKQARAKLAAALEA